MAAILEATLRVLDEAGDAGLTTTRVAEVAGVSVGTLYQYFPHRDALLNALLADHLEHAIAAVEDACARCADLPPADAVPQIVRAFLAAKAARVPASHILNKAFGAGMLDDRPLVAAAAHRAHLAIARVLARGAEPSPALITQTGLACAALEGMVRAALTEDPDRLRDPAWTEHVVRIASAAL